MISPNKAGENPKFNGGVLYCWKSLKIEKTTKILLMVQKSVEKTTWNVKNRGK